MSRSQRRSERAIASRLLTRWSTGGYRQNRRLLAPLGALVAVCFIACSGSPSALDGAPEEARRVVADLEAVRPPDSYAFSYSVVSPVFMACLLGVEDIDGVVDARNGIVRLTPHEREGDVFLVDGVVVIDRRLIRETGDGAGFVSIGLSPNPDAETLTSIENALGIGLSALIPDGSWPAHPNEIVRAAVGVAASIMPIAPSRDGLRAIRIVLDPAAYFDLIGQGETLLSDVDPPVVDAHVGSDGVVQRLVMRNADPSNPAVPDPDGDGYAMDFDFDPGIAVTAPPASEISEIPAAELPTTPAAIPCQLEP